MLNLVKQTDWTTRNSINILLLTSSLFRGVLYRTNTTNSSSKQSKVFWAVKRGQIIKESNGVESLEKSLDMNWTKTSLTNAWYCWFRSLSLFGEFIKLIGEFIKHLNEFILYMILNWYHYVYLVLLLCYIWFK